MDRALELGINFFETADVMAVNSALELWRSFWVVGLPKVAEDVTQSFWRQKSILHSYRMNSDRNPTSNRKRMEQRRFGGNPKVRFASCKPSPSITRALSITRSCNLSSGRAFMWVSLFFSRQRRANARHPPRAGVELVPA